MERVKELQWLVIYTKPRAEKKLAKILDSSGIEVYCPCYSTLRQWSDRKKMVSIPYFTSYLFVKIDYNLRNSILNNPLAICYVKWLGKPVVIHQAEMEAIKHFLEEYPSANLERSLNPGDNITITNGIFKNQKGIVVRLLRNKAVLKIDKIGYQITAEMKVSNLSLS